MKHCKKLHEKLLPWVVGGSIDHPKLPSAQLSFVAAGTWQYNHQKLINQLEPLQLNLNLVLGDSFFTGVISNENVVIRQLTETKDKNIRKVLYKPTITTVMLKIGISIQHIVLLYRFCLSGNMISSMYRTENLSSNYCCTIGPALCILKLPSTLWQP